MTRITNLLDVLTLEVEKPSQGLKNLLANASGELGAWAWSTAANGILRGTGTYLEFTTGGGSTAGPSSELLPVIAGDWIAASWYQDLVDAMFVYAWFDFYKADGTLVSSLPAAPPKTTTSAVRQAVAPVQVPALATQAKLSFGLSTTTPANTAPAAGKRFRFHEATVATATTAAPLGPVDTNQVSNPSFEGPTIGWANHAGSGNVAMGAYGAGTQLTGTKSLRLTKTSGTAYTAKSPQYAVAPGESLAVGIWRFNTHDVSGARFLVRFFNGAGVALAGKDVDLPISGNDCGGIVTVPAGAALVEAFYVTGVPVQYLDCFYVIRNPFYVRYFDGATPDGSGWDYSWSSAANASPSTANGSALPFIPPIQYQAIEGSAVGLSIQRRPFDATLTATIRDALLDPATVNLIRPGRAVRVRIKEWLHGVPQANMAVLFQGQAAKPAVDYGDLKRKTRPTITLTAYGPGAILASSPSPNGVATIAQLPAVLEGVRVPFKVNGSTDQVMPPAYVSSNDQATALDQVILTRDSSLGYAYVNRQGVLVATSDRTTEDGPYLFDEGDYTQLGLSFNPETIVNWLTVILLRFNSATGETEEVTYGPYVDQASVREWGPCPAEYRIHGVADPAAWAAQVLAANAEGLQRVDKLRVPITDQEAHLSQGRALLDLYAKANVSNTDRAIDLDQRVSGIDHTISWSAQDAYPRWYVDLLFDADETVAEAQSVTPISSGASDVKDGVWQNLALVAPYTAVGSPQVPQIMRKNGVTYLRGSVNRNGAASGTSCVVIPVGFRPVNPFQYVNDSAPVATSSVRLVAASDGTLKVFEKTGTFTQAYLGTSYPAEA